MGPPAAVEDDAMAKGLNWDKNRIRQQQANRTHEAVMRVYSTTTHRAIRGGVMPWGKHKGRRLSAIPQHYLEWLQNERPPGDWLRHMIAQELFRRQRTARTK
jgi:uncharacterized protein (DUF3820 family)